MNKNTLNFTLNYIYSWISMPALLIHQICHLVTGLFCGHLFSIKGNLHYWNTDGNFVFLLKEKNHKKRLFKSIIVSLSSLYFVAAVAILAVFYPCCRYALAYLLFTYRYSFPGLVDWEKIRYHKVYKDYMDNDRAWYLFFALKGNNKDKFDEKNFDFLDID